MQKMPKKSVNIIRVTSRRRRSATMSDSEIMTILLLFHFGSYRNFKHYYLSFIKIVLKKEFPTAVSYNRFVELEGKSSSRMMFFLNLQAFGRCLWYNFRGLNHDTHFVTISEDMNKYSRNSYRRKEPWDGVMDSNCRLGLQ